MSIAWCFSRLSSAAAATACLAMLSTAGVRAEVVFTPFAYPGASETLPNGIDGDRIVGAYYPSPAHGFYYDGSSYSSLYHPSATSETKANGIDGDTIVGYYANGTGSHGFTYSISGQTWQTVDVPGAVTILSGIDGARMVGNSRSGGLFTAFLKDAGGFTMLSGASLGASQTFASAIHGDLVGGSYLTSATGNSRFAYLYDVQSQVYTQFVLPFAGVVSSFVTGISDSFIVGSYDDATGTHGYFYNRLDSSWQSVDATGAVNGTYLGGVSGNRAVGYYNDANWDSHGFVVEAVPEIDPAGLSSVVTLLGGVLALIERRRRS